MNCADRTKTVTAATVSEFLNKARLDPSQQLREIRQWAEAELESKPAAPPAPTEKSKKSSKKEA